MNFVENQSTIMSAMSPLGSEFCDYFYYLTMINLILLAGAYRMASKTQGRLISQPPRT